MSEIIVNPLFQDDEKKGELKKTRSHTALNDLGRTDSGRQGVRQAPILQGSMYAPKKGSKFYVQTGQTQILFDSEETRLSPRTDRALTMFLSLIPDEAIFNHRENEVVRVQTTVKEIQSLYQNKDAKTTRAGIDEDIANLTGVVIRQEDAGEDLKAGIPLAGDICGRQRSEVIFSFSPTLIKLLTAAGSFSAYIPRSLYGVDMKGNAWQIGKKLINHSSTNVGKPNETILSVKALTEWVKRIPSKEEVASRNYTQKIIRPLERDLDELVSREILTEWTYCHEKGEPLTDEELNKNRSVDGTLNYEIAKDLFISWQLFHTAWREPSLEAKQRKEAKRLLAAEEKKKRRKKK